MTREAALQNSLPSFRVACSIIALLLTGVFSACAESEEPVVEPAGDTTEDASTGEPDGAVDAEESVDILPSDDAPGEDTPPAPSDVSDVDDGPADEDTNGEEPDDAQGDPQDTDPAEEETSADAGPDGVDETSDTAPDESEPKTYTLDVSQVISNESGQEVTGNLIVSHNAVAAFPVDLAQETKVVGALGAESLVEAQTLSACIGNENELSLQGEKASWWDGEESGFLLLADNHPLISNLLSKGPFTPPDSATITAITAQMPYSASQDDFQHIPGDMCFGVRVQDVGWLWDFNPGSPALNEALQEGTIEFPLTVQGVDMIGILVNSTTVFDTLTYTVVP